MLVFNDRSSQAESRLVFVILQMFEPISKDKKYRALAHDVAGFMKKNRGWL
jgi:hypothetical protein